MCALFRDHLPQSSGFRSAKQIVVPSFASQAGARIFSDGNIFCTLRGGRTTAGSNTPGAFLDKRSNMSNLQDFLLEFLMDEDLAEEDDLLNERLDIELRRVIADLNTPSSEGLKQENTLPSEEA